MQHNQIQNKCPDETDCQGKVTQLKRRKDSLPPDPSSDRNEMEPSSNERSRKKRDKEADRPWEQGWELTEEQKAFFREKSFASAEAKRLALSGKGPKPLHPINKPRLDPAELMRRLPDNGLRTLSLFSGGGGLDLGFDMAGYKHVASYDVREVAGETLRRNRPQWSVFAGEDGDVRSQDWKKYRDAVDVLHGGPPCQPFSSAGRQLGSSDTRDMFPEFVRAVLEIRPRAFVAENVAALMQSKFQDYLNAAVFKPLSSLYQADIFLLKAEWFGVPQYRTRVFIVGFLSAADRKRFRQPVPTHQFWRKMTFSSKEPACEMHLFGIPDEESILNNRYQRTMGVREALGLADIGVDDLAPTLRSGFTGPRGTTSVLSSTAALKSWGQLGIWPNGVATDREAAHLFVPENGNFRLSVQDCGILQGFPETWGFCGRVWSTLGQIGNSVAPPVAYNLAKTVASALGIE